MRKQTQKTTITKALVTTALIALVSTTAHAGAWEKKLNLGISGNKLEYNSNQDYNWGGQMEMHMVKKFESAQGLRVGWNIGLEYYTLGEVESLNDDAGMNIDAMILAGYTFDDKFKVPIELLGGVGYALGQIGKDYNQGLAYKGVATWYMTDGFGLGVQYKHVDLSVVTLMGEFDSGLDITSAFLSIKY